MSDASPIPSDTEDGRDSVTLAVVGAYNNPLVPLTLITEYPRHRVEKWLVNFALPPGATKFGVTILRRGVDVYEISWGSDDGQASGTYLTNQVPRRLREILAKCSEASTPNAANFRLVPMGIQYPVNFGEPDVPSQGQTEKGPAAPVPSPVTKNMLSKLFSYVKQQVRLAVLVTLGLTTYRGLRSDNRAFDLARFLVGITLPIQEEPITITGATTAVVTLGNELREMGL